MNTRYTIHIHILSYLVYKIYDGVGIGIGVGVGIDIDIGF